MFLQLHLTDASSPHCPAIRLSYTSNSVGEPNGEFRMVSANASSEGQSTEGAYNSCRHTACDSESCFIKLMGAIRYFAPMYVNEKKVEVATVSSVLM